MKIETYSFGKMVLDGQIYKSDLIVYPDKIDNSWWRLQGHLLQMDDLKNILAAQPETLIIGTGYMGVLRVPKPLQEELLNLNIELHIKRTKKAVQLFNTMDKPEKVIAAFHLTC